MIKYYIIWPENIDAALRARYAEVVGESIQSSAGLTLSGDFWAGSSRLTSGHIETLEGEFPALEIVDSPPATMVESE
jgi:tRNA A37 threonylcarbamoyladenosine biosynthesis protein TsaE